MKTLLFIHTLGRKLTAWSEAKMSAERKGKLFCADCGRAIHKSHKYKVLSVRHTSCGDPKLNGQDLLPQPLGRLVAGE